jgi:mono/diheme cytochrome c family protein
MRWSRIARVMLVLVSIAAATLALTGATATRKSAAKGKAMSSTAKAKLIARGRYLTTVMSCIDCHTPGTLFGAPDFDRQLSGSEMGWKGPWGISFPRNLTPDKETGLGTWTKEQIITAFRSGRRPDGRVLNPPMPWQNLASMTDDDANAIATYLMSLPPISHKNIEPIPPGQDYTGSVCAFPAPSAWDAPRTPPPAASGDKK